MLNNGVDNPVPGGPNNTEFLAFVIDNKVQLTMVTDERTSAIFRSNPLILDLSNTLNRDQIGPGSDYDPETGKIVLMQPYPSWILNPETERWEAPVDIPEHGGYWTWNENEVKWQKVSDDITNE